MATFDDFLRLELKTARILDAEKVEGADKLLKLNIDLGGEKRQLVAGIASSYGPEDLEGKTIIVIANLEPRKIKGIESQGMLLAAEVDGEPVLLTTDKEAPEGCRVK